MAYSYARAQSSARRMLAKYGNTATLTRTGTSGATTAIPTVVCVIGQPLHLLGQSGVPIGDQAALFDDRVLPFHGDQIVWGNDSGIVVGPITPFRVNGVDTTFVTALIRKG
jgi:hypothetical protein